jgi:hypothetical protein
VAAQERGEHGASYDSRRGEVRLAPDIEKGDLADRCCNPRILCRGGERIAAAHRGSEGGEALRVNPRQRAGESDRSMPVLNLAFGGEQVRFAPTVTEATMVEHKGRDARRCETLSEGPEPVTSCSREPMCHHNDRGRRRLLGRWIQPSRAALTADIEVKILSVHTRTTKCDAIT